MPDEQQAASAMRNSLDLSGVGHISPGFQHADKLVTSSDDLNMPHAYLKWYDIRRHEIDMPPELIRESRSFLRAEVEARRLNLDGQLGFVELHHCSSVAFLIVCVWINDNELWQATYRKDLVTDEPFELFEMKRGPQRAVFCVWELAPVWHERQAWVRYLLSERDEPAKHAYIADRFSGLC
ncbi:MAG TPA: hypothetical protein VF812_15630 [Ktedonobacterales bacterium]